MGIDQRRQNDIVVSCLRSAITEGASGLNDVPGLLKRIIREGMWRERVIQETGEIQPFERFIDFIRTQPLEGLGADLKTLQRLCADDPEALDALDRATKNEPGVNQYTEGVDIINTLEDRPDGTSAAYALRKLRADAPEMHARVLAGELSPHAGMVEAGYRKKTIQIPTEPNAAARALLRKFNADELQQIVEIIADHIDTR